jgi:hypothetical protein
VLENKKVIIDNFQDKETAMKVIEDAIAFYKQNFKLKAASKLICNHDQNTYNRK